MPPKIRFGREDIVSAALEIVRREGIEGVNARTVAAELGCSTQPLFREFETMEQIKEETARLAMDMYARRVAEGAEREPISYKGTGMAYIDFARREPQLFKLLFMSNRTGRPAPKIEDPSYELVISALMERISLSREQAKEFHLNMWVYVHGLAVMVATEYMNFTDEELSAMLSGQFMAMKALYDSKNGSL